MIVCDIQIKTIKLNILFKVATGKMTHKDSSNEDRSETINNIPDSMLLTSAELDHKNSTTIKDDNKQKKKEIQNQSKTVLTST